MKNTDVISFDEYLFTYSVGIIYFCWTSYFSTYSIISITHLFQNYAHIFLLYETISEIRIQNAPFILNINYVHVQYPIHTA